MQDVNWWAVIAMGRKNTALLTGVDQDPGHPRSWETQCAVEPIEMAILLRTRVISLIFFKHSLALHPDCPLFKYMYHKQNFSLIQLTQALHMLQQIPDDCAPSSNEVHLPLEHQRLRFPLIYRKLCRGNYLMLQGIYCGVNIECCCKWLFCLWMILQGCIY